MINQHYEVADTDIHDLVLSPLELAQRVSLLDDDALRETITPIAARLAESPELAAEFIDKIVQETLNLGTDLSPILAPLLEQRLLSMPIRQENIDFFINSLGKKQPQLIEIFKNLDPKIQQLFGALYLYLRINREMSIEDFFDITKKLNLARLLPKELWDVTRFGVSNTGHMNTYKPANLDYVDYSSTEEQES